MSSHPGLPVPRARFHRWDRGFRASVWTGSGQP